MPGSPAQWCDIMGLGLHGRHWGTKRQHYPASSCHGTQQGLPRLREAAEPLQGDTDSETSLLPPPPRHRDLALPPWWLSQLGAM